MAKRLRSILGLALFLTALGIGKTDASAQIAVVVNEHNDALTDVSMRQLRRIFLGQVTAFPDGTRIHLLQAQGPDTAFYRAVLDRSVNQIKKHWIGSLLSGGSGVPPEIVDVEGALEKVAEEPGAICFVPASSHTGPGIRVIRVEGLLPSDPAYPIREGAGA